MSWTQYLPIGGTGLNVGGVTDGYDWIGKNTPDWVSQTLKGGTRTGDASALQDAKGHADEMRKQFLGAISQYNRSAPQMDTSMFQAAANGQVPSAAELQMRQGQEQNLQNMMSMQASQRGTYNPAAARQALISGAESGQQTNAQTAILRAQEQAGARGQFLGALQGNQQAYLQNQGQNDAAKGNLRQLEMGTLSPQINAAAQIYQGQNAAENQTSQNRTKMLGGLTSAGGALGSAGGMMSGSGGGGGGGAAALAAAAHGGYIPGHAKVSGDSPANDTVPAKLSPGELVVPRSVVAQGPQAIAAFASQAPSVHPGGGHAAGGFLQAAQPAQPAQPAHFGHVLQALAAAHEKIGALKAKGGKRA